MRLEKCKMEDLGSRSLKRTRNLKVLEEFANSDMQCAEVKEFTNNMLDEKEAGILNALIIGDESKISSSLEESYKKAGMLHLLVVSGVSVPPVTCSNFFQISVKL